MYTSVINRFKATLVNLCKDTMGVVKRLLEKKMTISSWLVVVISRTLTSIDWLATMIHPHLTFKCSLKNKNKIKINK